MSRIACEKKCGYNHHLKWGFEPQKLRYNGMLQAKSLPEVATVTLKKFEKWLATVRAECYFILFVCRLPHVQMKWGFEPQERDMYIYTHCIYIMDKGRYIASFFLNLLLDLHFGVNPTSDHPVPRSPSRWLLLWAAHLLGSPIFPRSGGARMGRRGREPKIGIKLILSSWSFDWNVHGYPTIN